MGVEVARTGERRFRLHFLRSWELIGMAPQMQSGCRVVFAERRINAVWLW